MIYQTKRKILNSTVYIVLGLVITAVIVITIATFVGMRNKTPEPDVSTEEGAQSENTGNAVIDSDGKKPQNTNQSTSPQPATPDKSTSKTPDDNTDKQAVEPVDVIYCLPVTGVLQKEFSPELPIKSLTMNDYRTHGGIDISAAAGTAVAAMSDGTVLNIWSDPMMGMSISIDHGNGLISIYKNLDVILPSGVSTGAKVKAGQIIASVGNTCLTELADADHLHFEVTLNGKHVNPGSYVSISDLSENDTGVD